MADIFTTLLYVLITGLVGSVTVAVVYARWYYGTLERVKGLPVIIKPAFVGGSDVYIYKKIVHDEDTENVKKYGKIFGYYEGRFPHIYIADPNMLRLILIKDFDHFHNKRLGEYEHELMNELMDILPYEKWKVVRSVISPTLNTGKIRHMSIMMSETIQGWMETVMSKHEKNDTFEPKRMYSALTTDVITRCGFGTKLNSLDDPENPIVQRLNSISLDEGDANFLLTVTHIFPFLSSLAPMFPSETLQFFNNLLKGAMDSRNDKKYKLNDLVDTLNEMRGKVETKQYKTLGITELTVMNQALTFFLAGFETTASTLTYLTYNLATNPQVQEKLVAEVDDFVNRHNGKIEHQNISELTYLSACIQETLRMYPPLIRLERVCNMDWHHEPTGLHIPKDVVVQVPVLAIHYNEEYFPEPHIFKPERFLLENKDKMNPYAFLSFGAGNHNCIGMRFAKEEIHLTMANVLKNFTFKATESTTLKFLPGRTFLLAVEPFTVQAIKRY